VPTLEHIIYTMDRQEGAWRMSKTLHKRTKCICHMNCPLIFMEYLYLEWKEPHLHLTSQSAFMYVVCLI